MLRLVVLGDPIAHSRSPAIHAAALEAMEIAGEYTARRVDAAGARAAIDEIRSGRLDGANVTMPHKAVAADAADALVDAAHRSGSANTLVRTEAGVVGHTTDVGGIRDAWAERSLPDDGAVLILGAGGAAAAALLALEGREISIATRRSGAGEMLGDRVGVAATEIRWGLPVPGATVVNATPIGMHRESLPRGIVEEATGLFDMAYGSGETPGAARARRAGIAVADGLDMLVAQAARSFELWTGVEAPRDVMRSATRG